MLLPPDYPHRHHHRPLPNRRIQVKSSSRSTTPSSSSSSSHPFSQLSLPNCFFKSSHRPGRPSVAVSEAKSPYLWYQYRPVRASVPVSEARSPCLWYRYHRRPAPAVCCPTYSSRRACSGTGISYRLLFSANSPERKDYTGSAFGIPSHPSKLLPRFLVASAREFQRVDKGIAQGDRSLGLCIPQHFYSTIGC